MAYPELGRQSPAEIVPLKGHHLIIDAKGCNKTKLADENFLREILTDLPEQIGMQIIGRPSVYEYDGGRGKGWGYSGIVLIAESHITLHTLPEKGILWGDVFSCKPFDQEIIEGRLKETFEAKEVRGMFLGRSTDTEQEAFFKKMEIAE